MKYRIIADSSCDLRASDLVSESFEFTTVPIRITIDEKEFVDDEAMNISGLLSAMKASKSALKTSCPAPEAFAEEMRKEGDVICLTLSSKLSGAFSSASLAAEMVRKEQPGKNIFVLDSLSTSAGMVLMLFKLKALIEGGNLTFGETVEQLKTLAKDVTIRFTLQDFGNLIKSGRMSKLAGIIASLLIIRPICGDDGNGEIKICKKVLGNRKALAAMASLASEKVEKEGKNTQVVITHCRNKADAEFLKEKLQALFGLSDIKIYQMRGTASCYANEKGLSVAF